ncbi:MAG: hypothetical protein M3430_00835 [Acidobacteriota bacterium]|nr:hypothetical protein [Acidobacteriota bacterium]
MNAKASSARIAGVILITFAALIAAERLWAYDKPIEKDVSIYAVLGHELLAGRALYSDLLELRPPAVMVTYAAAEAVVGYGRRTIFLLYVVTTIITLLGIYYAASATGGSLTAGLWAAAFWAVLSGSYGLEAGEPNTEIFMNACLTWAFGLWVRCGEASSRVRRALIIGALFAFASLYKHVVVVCPALLGIIHVAFPPPGDGGRRRAALDVVTIAAVGVGVWALVSGYFAATGRFEIFREMMTGASLDYAAARNASFAVERTSMTGVILRNIFAPLRREAEFVLDMLTPLAVLTGLGVAVGIFRNRRRWALLTAFAVATWIEIALPGQFFIHYYQLWLPPLAVGAGWAVGGVEVALIGRKLNWFPHLAGAVTLSLLIASQIPFYRMNAAGDWSAIESREGMAAEPLAREINSLLAPDETFYEWGSNPSLYFHAKRRAPSGVLMVWWFLDGRLADQLSKRVIADLERAQPKLLVVTKEAWPENPVEHPVSKWLFERYRPLPGNDGRGPFALYVRRDGALATPLPPSRT